MTSIRVALAIGVVFVGNDFVVLGQQSVGPLHAFSDDLLTSAVVKHHFHRSATFGGGNFGVGVVDVVPGTIR